MLCDNLENLECDYKIDSQGKLSLPVDTNREIGEEIAILYNKLENNYEIYSMDKVEEKICKLYDLISKAKSVKEWKALKWILRTFCTSVIIQDYVDSKGKIRVGSKFQRGETGKLVYSKDHLIMVRSIKK